MGRLDDLIVALCPEGVRFHALSEISHTLPGLSGKTKADFSDGNARYISYMNVFTNIVVDQSAPDFVRVGPQERQNRVELGDVVITGSSESVDEVGMSSVIVESPQEALYVNSFCFVVRFDDPSILAPEFSQYLFRAESVRSQIRRTASGVTRINISKPRFMKVRIPVPPLEVQREIARILDAFTSLKSELEAELSARRRQYGFYAEHLLINSQGADAEQVSLGNVCRVVNGYAFKSDLFNSIGEGLPLVRIRDVNTGFSGTYYSGHYDERYVVQDGDMLIGMDGDFRATRWSHGTALLNQRVCRLQDFSEGVDPSFVFHFVRIAITRIQDRTSASTVKHLSSKQIEQIQIALPPLTEQQRTGALLDRLNRLVSDRSVGLPAELTARHTQFDYYRDALLSFEESIA